MVGIGGLRGRPRFLFSTLSLSRRVKTTDHFSSLSRRPPSLSPQGDSLKLAFDGCVNEIARLVLYIRLPLGGSPPLSLATLPDRAADPWPPFLRRPLSFHGGASTNDPSGVIFQPPPPPFPFFLVLAGKPQLKPISEPGARLGGLHWAPFTAWRVGAPLPPSHFFSQDCPCVLRSFPIVFPFWPGS